MLKKEILKELNKMISQEEKRLENSLKANEQIIHFPTKVQFCDTGFVNRISVLNVKNYLKVNKAFEKDFCPICGQLVSSEIFACDKKGQKMHIECVPSKE